MNNSVRLARLLVLVDETHAANPSPREKQSYEELAFARNLVDVAPKGVRGVFVRWRQTRNLILASETYLREHRDKHLGMVER